jgi:hypothetical protein
MSQAGFPRHNCVSRGNPAIGFPRTSQAWLTYFLAKRGLGRLDIIFLQSDEAILARAAH